MFTTMKSNTMFREQVSSLTGWFKHWNECEQTVALYSLLKKLNSTQAKFLAQVLEQGVADCSDLHTIEEKANSAEHLSHLSNEPKEKVISCLLSYLPLLRTGNAAAKQVYLKIIPDVLSHAIEHGEFIEESRQLLSYSLIHPAINGEERKQFTRWLSHLEERFTFNLHHQSTRQTHHHSDVSSSYVGKPGDGEMPLQGGGIPGPSSSVWQQRSVAMRPDSMAVSAVNKNGLESESMKNLLLIASLGMPNGSGSHGNHSHSSAINSNGVGGGHMPLQTTLSAPPNFNTAIPTTQAGINGRNVHTPLRRTASITPPHMTRTVSNWLGVLSNDDLSRGKFMSGMPDHAPLSPQSSVASSGSGSDSHHDDGPQPVKNCFLEEGSGMRDVLTWLKNLRLHKYAYLFQQMTYEDMLNLTEEWLEGQNVTKGARNKIVLSISKLRERQDLLRKLETDVMEGGPHVIKTSLGEMKVILNTPMKTTPSTGEISPPPYSPSLSEGEGSSIPEGDIPGQFTRLMGKVCTQLLVASQPDDECYNLYLSLIDKCINHEAFTRKQKKLLSSWKQKAQSMWQPHHMKYNLENKPKKSWGNTYPLGTSVGDRYVTSTSGPMKHGLSHLPFGARRSIIGSSSHSPLHRNNSLNTMSFTRPGLLEVKAVDKMPSGMSKPGLTRTRSAPLRNDPYFMYHRPDANDTEINARLDVLCRSMTDHALGVTGEETTSYISEHS